MLSRCFLDCSVGVGVFVTGLSQISSFFSYNGIRHLDPRVWKQASYTDMQPVITSVSFTVQLKC